MKKTHKEKLVMKKTHKEKLAILKDLNSGYRVGFVQEKHKINRRDFYNSFQRTYCGDWELKGKERIPILIDEIEKVLMKLNNLVPPFEADSKLYDIITELENSFYALKEVLDEQRK